MGEGAIGSGLPGWGSVPALQTVEGSVPSLNLGEGSVPGWGSVRGQGFSTWGAGLLHLQRSLQRFSQLVQGADGVDVPALVLGDHFLDGESRPLGVAYGRLEIHHYYVA